MTKFVVIVPKLNWPQSVAQSSPQVGKLGHTLGRTGPNHKSIWNLT